MLHYSQIYQLDHLRRLDPDGNELGSRLLTAAIGADNYCKMSQWMRDEYRKDLLEVGANGWWVSGLATAILSPSPWSPDGFFFEANGRLVMRNRNKMIATSDFYVAAQSVSDITQLFGEPSSSLEDGHDLRWIDLLIRQVIIREVDLVSRKDKPGVPDVEDQVEDQRFVYESDAELRLYLMPLTPDGVFTIAPVDHEIGLVSPLEPGKVYSVGCVKFADPSGGSKLFDVRNRNSKLLANDYPDMLRRAGIRPHSEPFSPHWFGRSCAAYEQRTPYRAAAQRSAREWRDDPDGAILKHLFEQPACARP